MKEKSLGISVDVAIKRTLLEGVLPIKTLSEEIEYPVCEMKRSCSGNIRYGLNIRKLAQIMTLQNDFAVLECMAEECGFKLAFIPKVRRQIKPDVCDYFEAISKAQTEIAKWIRGKGSVDELMDAICKTMIMTKNHLDSISDKGWDE